MVRCMWYFTVYDCKSGIGVLSNRDEVATVP